MKYFLASFSRFLSDFLNVFTILPAPLRKKQEIDLREYFIKIEKDINSAFQEIKRDYERE
ncbi:hypothetical protein [Candidatus Tisiphia endosymbiont of Beris chalybata]|uniref:hypothetical protein n=1 Tax=Candidatus Tisiphia endosymbiont of Beris chalybata TaxID=3066262 RepID=UPI00312C8F85